MYKVYSVSTDCEGNNQKSYLRSYADTLEKAIKDCKELDSNGKENYTYKGSYVTEINLATTEEDTVATSPYFNYLKEEGEKERIRWQGEYSVWGIERQKEQKKRETRRRNLLESWGTNEDEVRARDKAKEVEKGIYGGRLGEQQETLSKAKQNLKNILFNYEKMIEEAKKSVEEETKKLNEILNNPKLYSTWENDEITGVWMKKTYGIDDIGNLWTKAGGKEKWNKINLKKMGPLPIEN